MSQEEYIQSLENTIESLQNQVNNLTEMVKFLTKKQFGSSSEKTKNEIDGQMSLFNEAEVEFKKEEPDPTETTVRNYTRKFKGQKEKLLKDIPVEIVDYKPSRSGENPEKFLKGFKGYLHTDGYSGYNNISDITRCGCWAHLRRYFIEAIQSPAQKNKQLSKAEIGRNFCNELFYIDRGLKDMTCEDSKAKRLELEKPVLEAFWCWIDSLNPLNGSRLGKAVNYAKNQKPYMENYLLDGRCSLSNNLAENSIRPFTVGRKNWLFSASTKGAESSAIIYSLIETAKANNLNVYRYLQFILMAMPGLGKNPEPEMMAYVMPWAEKVIQQCKNK